MTEGDLVVVTGKIDQRVRELQTSGLVIGTLISIDSTQHVMVLLPSLDFWRGPKREVFLAEEQS